MAAQNLSVGLKDRSRDAIAQAYEMFSEIGRAKGFSPSTTSAARRRIETGALCGLVVLWSWICGRLLFGPAVLTRRRKERFGQQVAGVSDVAQNSGVGSTGRISARSISMLREQDHMRRRYSFSFRISTGRSACTHRFFCSTVPLT
jgi:hypothetical protein